MSLRANIDNNTHIGGNSVHPLCTSFVLQIVMGSAKHDHLEYELLASYTEMIFVLKFKK